jgi:hypothetical protein
MKNFLASHKAATALAAVLFALGSANIASANVVLSAAAGNGTAGSGQYASDYIYTYNAVLSGQETFTTAGGFTDEYCISDINGLVAGSASIPTTSGFSISQGASGGCPINSGVNSQENSGAYVLVTYTGSATIPTATSLPAITFYSTYAINGGSDIGYGGAAVSSTTLQDYNQGQLVGPVSATPEPATMTLFGSALLGIGFIARKRSKKS